MGSKRFSAAALFSIAIFWAFLLVGPVAAHHKNGHSQGPPANSSGGGSGGEPDGDADSDSGTAYTEDNDTNDGGTPNNVSDEGDNAHPSGKDRSVEHGNSGNQGNSESDPDDDGRGPDRTNGGPDKANGAGGRDLADQDGNNGCGNDDDFEDDNEGWCAGGKPPEQPPPPPPPKVKPNDEVLDVRVKVDTVLSDRVLGVTHVRPRPATFVAGVAAGRSAAGAPLPFTGWSIGPVIVTALATIAVGLTMLRSRRAR
jgi:hypothetical protein